MAVCLEKSSKYSMRVHASAGGSAGKLAPDALARAASSGASSGTKANENKWKKSSPFAAATTVVDM